MDYKKVGKLANYVIDKENVLEIASFFEELAHEDKDHISFKVEFYDKSSISETTSEVFKSGYFKRKDAKTIYFKYHSKWYDKEFNITLDETYLFSEITNTYEISSTDEQWYSATQKKAEDILSSFQKRGFFRKIFKSPWVFVVYFLYQLCVFLLMKFPFGFEFGVLSEKASIFIPVSVWVLITTALFWAFTATIRTLYPEMEFAFDTMKHLKRKKWRAAIWWIFTALIIPIVMGLLIK